MPIRCSALAFLLAVIMTPAHLPAQSSEPPNGTDKPVEEVFHNIQSLKGVPAGRFPLIMNFFSNSLGVQCSHCHVPDQWEKDDKEAKKTARKMLHMVTDIIHTFYGNQGQIGCYGCHEGAIKPELVASQKKN